ncbi:MAG: helix-turn-helix domain-containing protein [Natronomonas sp.]
MVRDPLDDDEVDPDLESVLGALYDEDCRTIIESLEEPMTARDLNERCDIPRSTLYRKLDQLSEATLLSEGTEIREDGSHASRYERDFDAVLIAVEEEMNAGGESGESQQSGALAVEIDRPARRADERLAELWSEVRKEL